MNDLIALTKRHVLAFLRDKTAVFFSFLSVLILLALYFLFIGKQYTSFDWLNEDYQLNITFTDAEKTYIVSGIMMGGILVINTVSLSLGIMGNVINDMYYKRLDGFLVTPIKRYKIILSYYLSSILVTSVLSIFMWVLTYMYVGLVSGYWYSIFNLFFVSIILIIYTFVSASMMIYLTTLMKSINAFGALSGVLGTFIGFASGIYIPLEQLGSATQYVASLLPFTHMSIFLKNILLEGPYQMMSDKGIPNEILDGIKRGYGSVELGVLGMNVSMIVILIVSLGIAVLFLFLAFRNMTKKMNKA